MLERKRAALRRALKSEYIKKLYNPKSYTKDGYVEMHDAAIMRYHAMQKTVPEFWFPSFKSFIFFSALVMVPILGHNYFHSNDRADFEMKCRSGEYAYDDVKRSQRWWSTV
jgi:NADH dehydrogenase (ubiquinone) 1 beta subcomplex subunit 4